MAKKPNLQKRVTLLSVLCAILAVAAVVFGAMALESGNDQANEMAAWSRTAARDAAEAFSAYSDDAKDYLYTAAVADFNHFLCLFAQVHGEDMQAEHLMMNEVYERFLIMPSISKTWIPVLVHALEILSVDLTNAHAHEEMLNIRNALAQGHAATTEDLTHSH